MLNPPRHIAGRGMYNIPTGHSLLLFGLSTKCCEDSEESQTTFFISPEKSNDYYNKRLLLCPCCFRRQATHRYYATSEGDRLFVTYHRNVHRRLVPLHIPSIRIFYIQDDVS